MRPLAPCPKCGSDDIIRVPAIRGGYGAGNFVVLGAWAKSLPVTRYVCGNCGFSEEWIDDPDDIDKLRRQFAAGRQ